MPPPDHEVLTLAADGSFTMWRTIARASRPPSPVGRFTGQLAVDQWSTLARTIDACRRAPPVELSLPPDAARDKVVLGKRISTWADDAVPPPPFDSLASELRELLGTLTTSPEAGITAELAGDTGARIAHLGAEPLELDLSQTRVRAVRWENGMAAGQWSADVDGPRSVTAGAGWVYELPFEHPHEPAAPVTVQVDDVLAFDGEFWRACSLQSLLPSQP
jgi:hypothetical protein